VISLTLARKYARALLEIGLREKKHELLGKDLEKVADLLQKNKDLRGVLFSSFYPAPKRKTMVKLIAQSLGLSKPVHDFIDLLIERERIDHFFAMVKSYQELCDEVSNRLRAFLTSAEKLAPRLVSEIKKQLESSTGKEVILQTQEDPSLIGGLVTKIGNVVYDGSLKTQLLRAKENLSKE
jgi:F-type H+-transporting ATPase subunit delta